MTLRQIFLDTETTGKSTTEGQPITEGHRVIEIGCVEAIDRRFTGNNFHVRLDPGRPIDQGATKVHGIFDRDLIGSPKFRTIASQLKNYLRGAEILIHNAPFDVAFLNKELHSARSRELIEDLGTVTDTLALARHRYPGQPNNLDALCKRYGISTTKRSLHGALIDASLLGEVYFALTGWQKILDLSPGSDLSNPVDPLAELSASRTKPLRVITALDDELEAHMLRMRDIHERHMKTMNAQLGERKERRRRIQSELARLDALPGLIEDITLKLASDPISVSGQPSHLV